MATSTSDASPRGIGGMRHWAPEAAAGLVLFALVVWAAIPLVYLAVRAASMHASLSGGDGLFAADQLQYLAWIRSSGEHVLAADGFDLHAGGHVFLHPMFVISGWLWRAGMSIALSFLIWLPVAVAVLYVGFARFVWRVVPGPWARVAALVLALFFVTPGDPLAGWTIGSNGLATLGGELSPAGSLYGYLPIAITCGLLALFMLGVARIVQADARASGRAIATTACLGLLVAWLHPWQGATALLVIAGVLVVRRLRRGDLALLIPAAATALPLGYYLLLSKVDLAWKIAQHQSPSGRPHVLLLVLALAPLGALAAVGWRAGDRREPHEQILWLWPVAALVVYFVSPEYAPHALEAIALPLAVLAVRGWQQLRLPAWLGAAAIALSTVPGLIYNLQLFHDVARPDPQALLLHQDERRALAYLDRAPNAGGVLPSLRVSAAVPAYTGRRTWIGHAIQTPDYAARAAAVTSLFSGHLSGTPARQFLRQVGARYVLADCEPGFDPVWLGSLQVSVHRFGCVDVYELAIPNTAASL